MENEGESLSTAAEKPRKRLESRRSSRIRVESSQEWARGKVLKGLGAKGEESLRGFKAA